MLVTMGQRTWKRLITKIKKKKTKIMIWLLTSEKPLASTEKPPGV